VVVPAGLKDIFDELQHAACCSQFFSGIGVASRISITFGAEDSVIFGVKGS
jgi:hypothetical protein